MLTEVETSSDHRPEASPSRNRRRVVLIIVAILAVVVLFGGGWVAAQSFESPAQKAAKAEAPPAGTVTATVASGNLQQTVSATATIGRTSQESVTLNAALASGVVTRNPLAAGARITAGTSILEISGRPLLAMPGAFPFYRDLTVGDHGPDVKQLQAGLAAAGFQVSVDGTFGAATTRAVQAMYNRSGYSIPTVEAPSVASSSGAGTAAATSTTAPSSAVSSGASTSDGSAVDAATTAGGSPATKAATQVSVPVAELIVFSSLPANAVTVPTTGTVLTATSAISVEGGTETATAPIASDATATITAGMTGTLTGPDGKQQPVTVSAVGPAEASPSADSTASGSGSGDSSTDSGVTIGGQPATSSGASSTDGSTIHLKATTGALPSAWLHKTGVAVITVDVAAKDSLIVPSIAVVSGGKGTAHVLKRDSDGTYISVPVTEVGALEGKSAIKPTGATTLKAGELVKVG